MSLASAIDKAAGHARNKRFEGLARPIRIDGKPGLGIYPTLQHRERIADTGGGIEKNFTASLRLRKYDWTALKLPHDFEGKEIELQVGAASTWQKFRVAEDGVADSRLLGEWRLTLLALL